MICDVTPEGGRRTGGGRPKRCTNPGEGRARWEIRTLLAAEKNGDADNLFVPADAGCGPAAKARTVPTHGHALDLHCASEQARDLRRSRGAGDWGRILLQETRQHEDHAV